MPENAGVMDRAVHSPFAANEPQRRFSGVALTIGLHALVIGILVIGFASLREPPREATLLPIALIHAPPAPSPQPFVPQQPTLIQPAVQMQLPPPVIDLSVPTPVAATAQPSRAPPVAPSPVATVAHSEPADVKSAVENWEGRVMAALQSRKSYPFAAMRDGQQDIVTVHVVLDGAGNVLEASVLTSKHFPLLDEAALDLLRRCSPLPPPPASALSGDRLTFDLPIDYTIRRPN